VNRRYLAALVCLAFSDRLFAVPLGTSRCGKVEAASQPLFTKHKAANMPLLLYQR